MNTRLDLALVALILAGVACARIAGSDDADPVTSEIPSAKVSSAAVPSDIRDDVSKLLGHLRQGGETSPKALGQLLSVRFEPFPDIPGSVRWQGPTQCGPRAIEVIPDDQPPGQTIVLTVPLNTAPDDQTACCLLKLADLFSDLVKQGYQASLSDTIDRKRLWFFQAATDTGQAGINAQVFTRPESTSEGDTNVCVNRISVAVGPRS